jgi:hypothetical protein
MAANADYIYTYTGSPYNVFLNSPVPSGQLVATIDSTTQLTDSGTFSLAQFSSVSITDGNFGCTVTNSSSTCDGTSVPNGIYAVDVRTNATGQISAWTVVLYPHSGILVGTSSTQGFFGFGGQNLYDITAAGDSGDAGSNVVGTWSESLAPVPLPASAWLMLHGRTSADSPSTRRETGKHSHINFPLDVGCCDRSRDLTYRITDRGFDVLNDRAYQCRDDGGRASARDKNNQGK